nr:MAG: ORF1 [TTV-like mini virus]
MPFYYRRRPYRRYYRRTWRRRNRKAFRKRWRPRRWKRYFPVRKRLKLRTLIMRQYNPPKTHKLKIRALIPLFFGTSETLSRNFSMYWYDTAEHYVPVGGGYSVICFNLAGFYQLFNKVLAYWTYTNTQHPLIRYTGATIKLFQTEHTDYITTYHNSYPMLPTLDTYNSTHPQIQLLNNRHKIVPCLKDRKKRKPYTKLKIKPPGQLIKKWYFQNEFSNETILMLMTSATSLDRYLANSNAQSLTIGFTSLNTELFQFHNWKNIPTSGYYPKQSVYLWGLENGTTDIDKEQAGNFIYLGQTKQYTEGYTINKALTTQSWNTKVDQYLESETHWGNPFMPRYLNGERTILITSKSPAEMKTYLKTKTATTPIGQGVFTTPVKPPIIECRYNPYSDNGKNHIFLESILGKTPQPWKQPTDPKLEGGPYPIWLSTFGFVDWQKNTIGYQAELDYIFVITSDWIKPPMGFYIPIDKDFLEGRSPYQPENTYPTVSDKQHWQPKLRFQLQSINSIATCGPGICRLPKQISTEAHAQVTFYFKLGGSGPPMQDIEDPKKQPQWTIPGNLLQQPSLQSPTIPLESFLYNFDERRSTITRKAAKRLQSIEPTKTDVLSFTDSNLFHQQYQETQETDSETETEKETLLRLIQQQQLRQQKFRQRILNLLTQQNIE